MKIKSFFVLVFIILCFSCATPPIYDDNWPVERYFRKAQEYSDKGNYKIALGYYDQIYARFPSRLDKVAAAEYEQGFIYLKMKSYPEAKELFETVLIRFSDPLTASYFNPSDEWVRYSAKKLLDTTNATINKHELAIVAKVEKKALKEAKKMQTPSNVL